MPDDPNYRVGHKRPPKQHQFPKGKSGNPGGRPKKNVDFHSVVQNFLNERTPVKNGQTMTKREIYVASLLKSAYDGKPNAFRKFIELLKGSRIFTDPPPSYESPMIVPMVEMSIDEWKRTLGRAFFEPPNPQN